MYGTQFAHGWTVGTGAALNIPLGWIPDLVIVTNYTDGDKITFIPTGSKRIAFTSGGAGEVVPDDLIVGATSGATARIKQVLKVSGTWAGGDAAGLFLVDPEQIEGTFSSENVDIVGKQSNIATVTAQTENGVDIDTEVASATGNASCASYLGTEAGAAKGFTLGSTVSESGKVLFWQAWRAG